MVVRSKTKSSESTIMIPDGRLTTLPPNKHGLEPRGFRSHDDQLTYAPPDLE